MKSPLKNTEPIRNRKKETIKHLIERLNKSTLNITKKGKKYHVVDVTQFDGDYGYLTEKELRKVFG